MFRFSDRLILSLTMALLAAIAAPAAVRADDRVDVESVERFLQDHALTELLAMHYRERIASTSGDERADIAEKLASVYAELLEAAATSEAQQRWERESQALLKEIPEADSLELRLSLARASFNRTEAVVERHRLRLIDAGEAEAAARTFDDLARSFANIASKANNQVETLERQEESNRAYDQELISTALAQSRRQRSLAHYFAGWSYVHAAELNGAASLAAEAMRHFGWLLNAAPGMMPTLERLPTQFLRYEHVARAVIGVAASLAIRGADDQAVLWLEALDEAEEIPPGVHAQLTRQRIMILSGARRWYDLVTLIESLRAPASADEAAEIPLPPVEARLLAIASFEADVPDALQPTLRGLRQTALADLVAQGELGHVLDLARQYGTASLAQEGFIVLHVRGLLAYEKARASHRTLDTSTDEPVSDAETADLYASAAELLRAASAAHDHQQYPSTEGANAMLMALSLYYGSGGPGVPPERLAVAAEAFVNAARLTTDRERAANAVWMGVQCLEELMRSHPELASKYAPRRAELIGEFLDRYPGHDRAAALIVRQATSADADPEGAVEDLLNVPESSAVHDSARRHAARILYRLFEEATPSQRDWAARRYVEVAEPLLVQDHRGAQAGDVEAASRAVIRARRLLDAMLSMAAPDPDRADRTLDVLRALVAGGMLSDPVVEAEIAYRRVQVMLARRDLEGAARVADDEALRSSDYAQAANRLLYSFAAKRWPAADEDVAERLARIIRDRGGALIRDFGLGADPLQEQAVATLYGDVAEAASWLWFNRQDADAREVALRLTRELLAAYPRNARFLRLRAEIAESVDSNNDALDAWRTLVSGLEDGTEAWYEARWRHVSLLARTDPDRARTVLTQHRVLKPDYGPEPWGSRLRALHEQLGDAPGERGDG